MMDLVRFSQPISGEERSVSDTPNPWLAGNAAPRPEPVITDEEKSGPRPTGPTAPQVGIPAPDVSDQLPTQAMAPAELYWLGVHGGAGESTLEKLEPDWLAAGHQWPKADPSSPARVVLVARTHMHGLRAAQNAASQWASGLVPNVEVLGLVLIADAPGRIPKPLREFAQLVSGGVPRTWQIPWIEQWRFEEHVPLAQTPRAVRHLIEELATLVSKGANTGTQQWKENL